MFPYLSLGADDSDFVHVNKDSLPSHDSAEVQASLPPKHIDQSNASETDQSKLTVNHVTPTSTNGNAASAATTSSNTSSSPNKAAASDESDKNPLFSRTFVMNPHIDHSTIQKERVFTIASYNILAECHAVRGFKEWNQYQWTTEEKLYNKYRHNLIWKELDYLDADIYCLQEVPPKYFHELLLPAFQA